MFFKILSRSGKFKSRGMITPERRLAEDYIMFQGAAGIGIATLDDDICIKFFRSGGLKKVAMFQCWFNTRMITKDEKTGATRLLFKKIELDKAIKDKNHKLYSPDMSLELIFHTITK